MCQRPPPACFRLPASCSLPAPVTPPPTHTKPPPLCIHSRVYSLTHAIPTCTPSLMPQLLSTELRAAAEETEGRLSSIEDELYATLHLESLIGNGNLVDGASRVPCCSRLSSTVISHPIFFTRHGFGNRQC